MTVMAEGAARIFDLADLIDARCGGKRIVSVDIGGGLSANYKSDRFLLLLFPLLLCRLFSFVLSCAVSTIKHKPDLFGVRSYFAGDLWRASGQWRSRGDHRVRYDMCVYILPIIYYS